MTNPGNNIRSRESCAANMWDYSFLNGCFGNDKIKAGDIDLFVEINGYFLQGECKPVGAKPERGQMIALEQRARDDRTTVVILWGTPGNPESYQILGLMAEPAACDRESFRAVVKAWSSNVRSLPTAPELDRNNLRGWLPKPTRPSIYQGRVTANRAGVRSA